MPANLSELDWRTHQGQHLLCDLQGGGYDTHYVLTDPAVLSMKQEFGATDGGKKMMQNLGQRHARSQTVNINMAVVTCGRHV